MAEQVDPEFKDMVVEQLAKQGGEASRAGDADRLKDIVAEAGAISDDRGTPGNSLGLKFG